MKALRILPLVALATLWTTLALAQPPVPHELLGHKESTFKIPRTRPFDWYNFKWFGGSPDLEEECGGCCHCFGRPAVWRCYEYLVPPDVPTVTIYGEYFALRRLEEDNTNILFNNVTNAPLVALDDAQFDYEPGFRVRGQYNVTHLGAFEAIYFASQEMHSSDLFVDLPLAPIRFEGAGVTIVGTDPFQVQYSSDIQSGELNFRRYFAHGSVSLLAGARWIDVEESLQVGELGAANQFLVEASNHMLGVQCGIEGQHWVDYGILRLDFSLKGGLFQNTTEQTTSYAGDVALADGVDTSGVVEGLAGIVLPLNRHIFVRGGYQVTYLSGVATAGEQLSTTNLGVVPPEAEVNTDGRIVFHGYYLGLEAWW